MPHAHTRLELVEKELTGSIIRAFYYVYNQLGYGFLEKIYAEALARKLTKSGLGSRSGVEHPANRLADPSDGRQDRVEQHRVVRHGNILDRHALDWGIEEPESLLRERRRDFSAESGRHVVLVDDDAAAGLLD